MDIGSVMKRNVVWLNIDVTFGEAIDVMIEQRVGLLPLLDDQGKLQGILNLRDILSLAWPTLLEMIDDFEFVHNFGALETSQLHPGYGSRPVSEFMQAPTAITQDCGFLRAAAVMSQHRLRDIPVVDDDNRLVGLASWVDVGVAFLRDWRYSQERT